MSNQLAQSVLRLFMLPPALVLAFAWLTLAAFLTVTVLLAFRMFVLFPDVACGHCAEKRRCPNAQKMGLG